MLPKAILFDLDDTIVQYNSGIGEAWVDVCTDFCRKESAYDAKALLDAINEYRKWYWSDRERHRTGRSNMGAARRHIVEEAFRRLGIDNREGAFEIADNYSRKRLVDLELFPDALETLERLKEKGIRLALLTNGDAYCQRYKINKFGLEKYFDAILIETELGFGKPDRRVFETALSAFGISPADAWMVGDNLEWDVKGAQELGIHGVWMDFRKEGPAAQSPIIPDRIINRISELLD